MRNFRSLIGVFLGFILHFSAQATPISICMDTNFWYPFSFVKDDKQPAGLHIDIIRQSLEALGYTPSFRPLPWTQCLSAVKAGQFDAVATISYNEDRSSYLNYPIGASTDTKSPWRVTQVEYRVITPTVPKTECAHYQFNGDMKTIPNPVRVPTGYSIVESLEQQGLEVKQTALSIDNFKQLVEEKTGSVIDIEEVAQHFCKQPQFNQQLIISSQPLVSKSYFLAFSKRGTINPLDAEKIWSEIAKTRDNHHTINTFLLKY